MIETRYELGHVIDAKTGFEIAWECYRKGRTSYSQLKVPNTIPSRLRFGDKSDLDVLLTPLNLNLWHILGIMGTDTLANLDRASEPRDGDIPPLVTEIDIERFGRFGRIIEIQGEKRRFGVDVKIPTQNVLRFLHKVWPTDIINGYSNSAVPEFSLGEPNRDYRILPQKTIPDTVIGNSLVIEKI